MLHGGGWEHGSRAAFTGQFLELLSVPLTGGSSASARSTPPPARRCGAHSPIHHVRRGMPPVLLIHGTNERLWAQGQSMSRVLTERGVPHELIALEGAPHGLENREGHASWMRYKSRLIDWLREQLRQKIPER